MMNWSNDAGINMSEPQTTDKRPVNWSEVGIRCPALVAGLSLKIAERM
jgi:hypothetical protein